MVIVNGDGYDPAAGLIAGIATEGGLTVPDALNEIVEVLELALLDQVHVPLWLAVVVKFLSAIAVRSLLVPPFRMVYPAMFNAPLFGSMVIAAMTRSLG